MAKSIDILKEISQLISSVENSSIQKTDKLKIIKVLLTVKLKLIEFLKKELKIEAKAAHQISMASINESVKISDKQDLIIQFIKGKNGPVSAAELLSLGIAGRSLRRYIKSLVENRKIKIQKFGRNYFYLLA